MKLCYNRLIIITLIILSTLSVSLFAGQHWDNKIILPPNPAIGRLDAVISNIAFVRFYESPNNAFLQSNVFQSNRARIIEPIIKPEFSVTFNKEQSKTYKLNNIQSISEIIKSEAPLLRTYIVEYDGDEQPEQFCKRLKAGCSSVEYAEPYYIQKVLGEFIPNDTLLSSQAMLKTIKAFEAWNIFIGDSNVVVGISDSGVLQEHEDLRNSLWVNHGEIPDNGIDDDGNGFIDDYIGVNFAFKDDSTQPGNTFNKNQGHGTGVAGLSSATTNNITGIAGVGFNCRMFPMKTMPDNQGWILYGYQSMIYAARMGFKVLNCSWGGYSRSCTDQSIIDYASSLGLAIVAGAGNHGSTLPFYPAAYNGVLAVGVTNPDDIVVDMSAIGHFVGLMAPGDLSFTTGNNGGYGGFCCTSGASPIVAGALALIRAKHPELSPAQAIEFAHLCSDNIEDKNPNKKGLIPGRINLLKAVTLNPFSLPGLRVISTEYFRNDMTPIRRFNINDTVNIRIYVKNILGEGHFVKFKISTVGDSTGSIEILAPDEYEMTHISRESNIFPIEGFRVKMVKTNSETPFLRIDITDGNNNNDYFLIPVSPSSTFTTFDNGSLSMTMADNGRIGFADPPFNNKGDGFKLANDCNLLYEGGLIITANAERVVSNVRKFEFEINEDFAVLKPFAPIDETLGILTDAYAPENNKIGVMVNTRINIPDEADYAKIDYSIKNISLATLSDISAGCFFDWDIGMDGDSNIVTLYPDGIPPSIRNMPSAAAVISRPAKYPLRYPQIGMLVFTNNAQGEPQLASFENQATYDSNGFSDEEKIAVLNSGATINTHSLTDIASAIGMKFPGLLRAGDSLSYSICLCSSYSLTDIRNLLWICADPKANDVKDKPDQYNEINISPQPAKDEINLSYSSKDIIRNIEIFDLLGNSLIKLSPSPDNTKTINTKINISQLNTGLYIINISSDKQSNFKKILVIR